MFMEVAFRIQNRGTWWSFEIKPTDEELAAFENWTRPGFWTALRNLFKEPVKANRACCDKFPDIAYYFDSINKAWYRES